jgi:uncharacterized protein YbjT (DUF2867 family)
MILVTGAAGKTGQAVIRALKKAGVTVRAFIHAESQRDFVSKAGSREEVIGDLLNPDDLILATNGTRAIYHIAPNVHPKELEIGELVISAAKGAMIDHFVYHSVLHPQVEGMPHHWQKLRVEERLIESGLQFTILQPTAYMQNITSRLPDIIENSIYQVPYPVDTQISLVDLEDVAQVAALVLTDPEHRGATYELVGTEAFSQQDVSRILGKSVGKAIPPQQIPLAYWEKQSRESGLDSYQISTLVKMFRHYQLFGFSGSTGVLEWLLGRQPTTLEECLGRELAALRRPEN